MKDKDLRSLQETRETQGILAGAAAYKQRFSESSFSTTSIGGFIMGKAMADLEEAIEQWKASVVRWRNPSVYAIVHGLPTVEIATVVLKTLLDKTYVGHTGFRKASASSNCVSSMSIQLGGVLMSHFNWFVFRTKNQKTVKHMERFLEGKSKFYRSRTVKWYKELVSHEDQSLPTADKASLGYPILRLAVESTGLFEIIERQLGNRRASIVVPSPVVINSVMGKLEELSLMHPVHQPMVCPPDPWTSWNTGGYLTLDSSIITHQSRTARELDRGGYLAARFEALNKLQAVPWEINQKVLEVAEWAYRNNHHLTPSCDIGVNIPPRPWETRREYLWLKENKPELVKEWSTEAAVIMNEFYGKRAIGQRLTLLRCLSLAKEYQQFDRLWFPWRMDYRGRFYPLPHTLNPQGDDLSRALLRFHQRTPLTPQDTEGWKWFLVQGANLMGQDKVPFEERWLYIRSHHDEICGSSLDPRECEWWTTADKPWSMLAWATEYQRITSGQQAYTQLPVNLDGRCNGLQHLAAASRDEQTGALVCLVPDSRPADIYTTVLEEVQRRVPEDSYWSVPGRVTRSLVKRNVMTTPYNVTKEGMLNQLCDELLSHSSTNSISAEERAHARDLRDINHETISSLLGKTMELMQWYNKVASAYIKQGLKLSWVLPDGFRVIQDLPKTRTKQVALEGRTVFINYMEYLDEQQPLKNRSAFSPNVTHSLDATHLALWIRGVPNDVPFVTIHDSYGVPAPYVSSIGGRAIVETFVQLYESYDIVEVLREDYRRQTGGLELPTPPTRGSLDLSETLKSTYAFA